MNKLNIGLTVTIVLTTLLTIYLSIATITNSEIVQGYKVIGWGYIYVYFLFPTIIILFLILTINYILKSGITGLINLRWNFILLILFIIMFSLTGQLNKFYAFKEKVIFSIENKMADPIEILRVYGRHDLVEIRDLNQGQKTNIEFRGKHIDYRTVNYLENRIYLESYANKKWANELIVDPWTVMTWDTLNIEFIKQDSIVVSRH